MPNDTDESGELTSVQEETNAEEEKPGRLPTLTELKLLDPPGASYHAMAIREEERWLRERDD